MLRALLQNTNAIPTEVALKDVGEPERLEERFFGVEGNIGDIVGMLEDAVEFCPNNEPPTRDEVLAWLWVIKPEHKDEIVALASGELREIIADYDADLRRD